MIKTYPASIQYNADINQISCQGEWTLYHLTDLILQIKSLIISVNTHILINTSKIIHMDSSGAWQLHQLITSLQEKNVLVKLQGLPEQHRKLLNNINTQVKYFSKTAPLHCVNWLARLGQRTTHQLLQLHSFLNFIGELTLNAFHNYKRLRWRSLFSVIETMGYQALPIIALLSFMIGVVLAYQMGVQLKSYGANIYVVDLIGLAVLREFAPLLTAIMIAGRTGSAFTAELGTMKLNEEIDALKTMGITPGEFLILPRIFGLIIALPLLTVWADIFGVLGGMVMAKNMLNISWQDFINRFETVIPVKSLIIGISKAPVFALLIASIGCFQGMQVANSADSVGKQTTKSVVQAIFFIIVADALFSIIFNKFGI